MPGRGRPATNGHDREMVHTGVMTAERSTGESSMKTFAKSWAIAGVLAAVLVCFFAPSASAQNIGVISGNILDVAGKPWVDLSIQAVSDQGAKSDAKTDKDGNFTIHNLKAGIYQVTIQLPAPNPPWVVRVNVTSEQPG